MLVCTFKFPQLKPMYLKQLILLFLLILEFVSKEVTFGGKMCVCFLIWKWKNAFFKSKRKISCCKMKSYAFLKFSSWNYWIFVHFQKPQPSVTENQVLSITYLSRSEYFFYKILHPFLSLPVFSSLGFLTREMEWNVIYINRKLEGNVNSRKMQGLSL